jgi:hypothetical protein
MSKAFREIMLVEKEDWKQAMTDQLQGKLRTTDDAETTRMHARARNYTLINGMLYKKGVVQPLLKCITQGEGEQLLREIHSGSCGSHIGARSLSAKAIRQGFYWPTHIRDAEVIAGPAKHAK